jgi:hypothetical protein
MRLISVSLLALSLFGLTACASMGKKPPPPANAEDALPPEVAAIPNDGTERLENNLPPPKRKGFFSKLGQKLGSDSDTPNAGPCPAVRILYENSRFVEISGANKFDNVGFTGEIQNVTSSCRYVGEDPISIKLNVDMALGKGPMAQGNLKEVKYWVAVTRKDIAPISKNEFSGNVKFPNGANRVRLISPDINIKIPRADKDISGINFEVLVGFELTPEQLEFNRNGIRFRIDAGVKD